jgi:hypothetical protein
MYLPKTSDGSYENNIEFESLEQMLDWIKGEGRGQVVIHSPSTYMKYIDAINPENIKRGFEWQLDHKYSISQGFIDTIEPEIIASPYNLQMLPQQENGSKNYRCDILKEELMKLYEQDTLQTRNVQSN